MYEVKLTNNYHFGLTVAFGGENIGPGGGTGNFSDWGTTYVTVPGMGDILFIDLGEEKLPQFTDPNLPWTEHTWGCLIRYQGLEAYFRYEGGGEVTATVNKYGSLELEFSQGGMVVSVDDITVTDPS